MPRPTLTRLSCDELPHDEVRTTSRDVLDMRLSVIALPDAGLRQRLHTQVLPHLAGRTVPTLALVDMLAVQILEHAVAPPGTDVVQMRDTCLTRVPDYLAALVDDAAQREDALRLWLWVADHRGVPSGVDRIGDPDSRGYHFPRPDWAEHHTLDPHALPLWSSDACLYVEEGPVCPRHGLGLVPFAVPGYAAGKPRLAKAHARCLNDVFGLYGWQPAHVPCDADPVTDPPARSDTPLR